MMRGKTLPFLLVLCALAAGSFPASAQLQTGDLYGTVADEAGGPLPGVTVTLTGVGAPRVTVSDSRGAFRFLALYPGEYAIRAALEGFSTVEQGPLGVRIGGKTEVEVTLRPAVAETITITAEQPLLNAREQSLGRSLSQAELDKIPTARDPWSLLTQAPGVLVDRVNVGGNESGQQADFAAAGATATDNAFAVDGVILTDMAAVGASATYFDFGAYEEVQLTTASTDVTIQTAGVTVNQVTKRGTNQWRSDGRYLRTEGSWQSSPREADGNEIDSVEEYGANVGGPFVADHLWGWVSYGESDIGNIAQGGQLDRTELEDLNAKLNFQAGKSSGVLHFWTNDKIKTGRNAGPLFAPESTWNQTTPQDIWKVEDTHVFGNNVYGTVLYSQDDGKFTLTPQGGLDADMFIDEDGVVHGSYFDFTQDAVITQYRGDANVFLQTGDWTHELKFGAGYREQENDSLSQLPRGRYVHACEDYGCFPTDEEDNFLDDVELVVWIRHNVHVTSEYKSAWVQDTISHDRWTISAGLRYDDQSAVNNAAADPGNPETPGGLFPAIDFPGNDADGLDWKSLVPRVGVTYAAGEGRKTLLRGTFSQYAAQLGQNAATRVGPFSPYSYVYYYFQDANQNLVFDPEEAGSLSYYYAYAVNVADPGSIVSANRNDPDLDPHVTDELTLGVQHAFGSGVGVSATLLYRNTHDLLEFRELVLDGEVVRVATREDYVLSDEVTVDIPGRGTVTVPIFDLNEDLSRTGGNLLTNGDREIEYWGLTLGFVKPLADHWSLRGNFTWSDSQLKVGDEFRAFDDPTDVIFAGNDGFYGGYGDDSDIFAYQSGYRAKRGVVLNNRWSFNVNGVYQVAPDRPWGFDLAANLTGREGYPTPPFVGSNATQLQLTESLDDFRNEDIVTFDARVSKEVDFGGLAVTFSLDGFNLFDSQPVLQVNRNFSSNNEFTVLERLSPRVFRWGVTFRWH